MLNRYGKLASWVYDLDKPVGTSFGDVEFYRNRLADCDGPVLEPAVGNGRILIPLAQAGLEVEGFDTSAEMLALCAAECARRGLRAGLSRQGFADFGYDRRFAAIILPAGSFQLIGDTATAIAVLRRFHDHLAPGGRLIVDLDPIGDIIQGGSSQRSWQTEAGDLLVLAEQRVETRYIDQTTLSHLRYEHWRDGRLLASELELFGLRWWGVAEFAMALRAAGFATPEISGNHQPGRPPREGDAVISFEARRARD
ncbi:MULTISPECIES: class I SAM-dependent methyltransferase [unclassified Paracoccus (in: a-proteobacteria)]|uniref:methyltransferase domain-containing protein n=1 Tax=unclassified Paracoccus (in: a-proteobacteria) TaxID=2688777 RepID=UPI0012B2771D|nr:MULTISPECIES: class I SAM-dependent methyltransferase [unclassified Paracoccus (in: a-proteobacteria)]UXU75622.1 class I SAM-dependent methyltransferase [Paracoccus sp. SMMA_5]UXU81527.1 class I SAM-dependent methyltransferase [Paracoccus sp. SMMA_5_TC]